MEGIKKKKLTYAKAKKQAWDVFSKWIRYREFNNPLGYVRCVTCQTIKHPKELQAGHFIPGRHISVLFDERNCHPQCYHCNVGLKGNPVSYYKWMLEYYGQEIIDKLISLDKQPLKLKVFELVEIKEKYKTLCGGLIKNV